MVVVPPFSESQVAMQTDGPSWYLFLDLFLLKLAAKLPLISVGQDNALCLQWKS